MFTPSIVPSAGDTVFIVEDDFRAKLGRVYRETDPAQCDRETTLQALSTGQYNDPGGWLPSTPAKVGRARCLIRICG